MATPPAVQPGSAPPASAIISREMVSERIRRRMDAKLGEFGRAAALDRTQLTQDS